MKTKIRLLLERLREKNEGNGDEQSIRKHDVLPDVIATLDPERPRKLSPMLRERFEFAYEWVGVSLGQTWLGLDKIERALDDPKIKRCYDLRYEYWERDPPAATRPEDTTIYGVDTEDYEETYLVWVDDNIEPHVYTFFDAQVDRFFNLQRYLEYLVGDRDSNDNDPSMYSPEGKNYKLV